MGAFRACVSAGLRSGGCTAYRLRREHLRAPRGFTLLELSVALFVLGVLSLLAGITYVTVTGGVQRLSAGPAIALVQLDARRSIDTSAPLVYPTTLATTLVCTPPACPPGVTVTGGESAAPDVVSLYRFSDTVIVLAAGSSGGCLVLVDRLTAPPSWVWDPELTECSASSVASAASAVVGGSSSEPVRTALS